MKSLIAVLTTLAVALQDPAPTVDQLVERLRSGRIEERNEAERQLKRRGEAAIPALRKALQDPDAEVAARAQNVLDALALVQKLTPNLMRRLPDAVDRLSTPDRHAWTTILLEAARQSGARRAHPDLIREDLLPLAPLALKHADKDEQERVLAIIAAWRLETAASELIPFLDEKEWNLRQKAFEAIVACRATSLLPELLERFHRDLKEMKSMWVEPIVRVGGRQALPDLLSYLLSQPGHDQAQLLSMISDLDAMEVVPYLLKLLRLHGDPFATLLAVAAIAPEEILPTITKLIEEGDEDARQRTVYLLQARYRSPEAIPALTRFLDHQDPSVRSVAILGLSQLRVRDAIPAIRLRLDDDAVSVRRSAASALATFGIKDGISELLLQLQSPGNKIGPAFALWRIGNREGVPALLDVMNAPKVKDPNERDYQAIWAANVLAQMGAGEVRPALLKLAESADPNERQNALWSLTVLDGPQAARVLKANIGNPDSGAYALSQLELLGIGDVLPEVRALIQKGTEMAPFARVSYLCRFAPKEALPHVLALADSPEIWQRTTAANYLARLDGEETVAALRTLLTDPDGQVRKFAADGLASRGHGDGLALLLDPWVQTDNHLRLNGVRRPGVWRTWSARTLAGPPLTGSPRELAEQFTARTGIAIDWPSDGSDLTNLHDRWIRVEGRDLLSVLLEVLQESANAVFEADRVRIQGRREARQFWLRWWAQEQGAAGRALLERLDDADRRRADWKRQAAASVTTKDQELQALLSPAVRELPGIEERLRKGTDETWIEVATELACINLHNRNYRDLTPDDLTPIALRAWRAAVTTEDKNKVLQIVLRHKLKAAVPLLRPCLKERDPALRGLAAGCLVRIERAAALPAVDALLEDPDFGVRSSVAGHICGERLVQAVPRLRSLMQDPAIRNALAFGGADMGIAESTDLLVEYVQRLQNQEAYIQRMQALWALTPQAGSEYNGKMIAILRKETDPQCREILLRHLGYVGAKEAIPDIIAVINNPGNLIPDHFLPRAIEALGQLGGPEATAMILKRVRQEPPDPKAIEVAAQMGLTEALPTIRKILASKTPIAASMIDPLTVYEDRESIPPIRALMAHSEPQVRFLAALGLAKLGDRESFPRILEITREKNESRTWDPSVPLLYLPRDVAREDFARCYHASTYWAYSNIPAVAYHGGEALVPILLARLSNPDFDSQYPAMTLGRIGGEKAMAALRDGLTSKDPYLPNMAPGLLCRNGLRDGLPKIFSPEFNQGYSFPYLELNAIRSPETWKRLESRSLKQPITASMKTLLVQIAKEADLELELPPAGSSLLPILENHHRRLQEWGRPLSLLECLERLIHSHWAIVLEQDRIRVLARKDAKTFWNEWWAKEKK